MSSEFVVKRRRRRNIPPNPTPDVETVEAYGSAIPTPEHPTPLPPSSLPPTPTSKVESGEREQEKGKEDSLLPDYLMNPPDDIGSVELQEKHTRELVCSFRVAKEILGSSFRPNESNLAVGKITL